MKSTIVLLCMIFMITISKNGQGQSPPEKSAGKISPKNQKAKTNRSGTNILMDEKNQQKEGTVPVRTNSSQAQNSTPSNKIVPKQPRRDSIFDMFDPGWIKQREGKSSSFNDIIVSSRTSKDVPVSGKKTTADSSKNKQQAEFRNKPQRN